MRKPSRAKRQPPPVAKPKELFWIGSALKDFGEFPAAIRPQVGFNLRFAQNGESGEDVKVLQGFGSANVKEIVSNTQGDTFRTVYTIEWERAVYILHCFQKKSHQGTQTDETDLDLIKSRLKEDAAEMILKSDLAIQILRIKKSRGLTQRKIAALAGLETPDVSDILNGRLERVSVERLFKTLNRLGRGIEIRVASEERRGAGQWASGRAGVGRKRAPRRLDTGAES